MKIKNILMMMAAGGLLGGCAEVDDQAPAKDPVAIQLTATVEGETALPGNVAAWTRADADGSEQASHESQICLDFTPKADAPSLGVAVGSSQSDNAAITGSAFAEGSALGVSATTGSAPAGTRGIQETSIANGQTVYLWADKGSAGTYTFLQAWELTSDGSGSLSGSTKYYPSDGAALTFRAVHGNFSSVPTSSTAVSTALTHSVATDQNSGSNYQLSDLMYGEGSGSYQSAGTVAFTHKLSKIEVNLTPGIGITASDIASAVVKVRYVKPTVTITPNNGTVSSASGTATTITAHRNGTLHEAVLPPQAAPDGVLSVTINGITATIPNAVTTFAAGNKYVYNVTCTNKDKRLNPLWYVAENNVKSYNSSTKVVTLETNPAAAGSAQCYSWYDAMAYFSKQGSSYDAYWAGDITDGTTAFKYHLPCMKEWISVVGSYINMFDSSFLPSGGLISSAQTCIFGYNDATKAGIADWSYWSPYSEAVSGHHIRYALRYLGTPYCSVWKYDVNTNGHTVTITSRLIDYLEKNDASLGNKLTSYMNDASFWTSLNEDEGALKRIIYFVGWCWNGGNPKTGTADAYLDTDGYYWSTTETSEEDACRLLTSENNNGILRVDKPWHKVSGFSVRLFRNEGVGEARTDPGVPLTSNLVSAGDVIADNSLVYKTSTLATENGHTPVALIYQIGNTGNSTYTHGIAIALSNVSSSKYKYSSSEGGTCSVQSSNFSTAKSYMDGVTYTATLVNSSHSSHGHAAAIAANNYTPTISGAKWFLPSFGQWCAFFNWCNGGTNVCTGWAWNNNVTSRNNVYSKLTGAGGSNLDGGAFFSSTEYNTAWAVYICFNVDNGIGMNGHSKTKDSYVRAFLAW